MSGKEYAKINITKQEIKKRKVTFLNDTNVQESIFSDLGERLRNIQNSPSGIIYLLTDGPSGKLVKVLPN